MKQGLLSVILSLAAVLIVMGCSPDNSPSAPAIYVLNHGLFQKIDDPADAKDTVPLPWPSQTRITHIYTNGRTLFLLVNGYGIAVLNVREENPVDKNQPDAADPAAGPAGDYGAAVAGQPAADPPAAAVPGPAGDDQFSYYYTRKLFGGRSSGRLYRTPGALLCHVYRDEMTTAGGADTPAADIDPTVRAASFIRFPLDEHGLGPAEPLAPGWQKEHTAWQAVVINPLAGNTVAVEWKLRTTDRVRFHYTAFDLADGQEEEHNREWFLGTFTFTKALGTETPAPYAALFRACINKLTQPGGEYLLHFTVTATGAHRSRRFAFQTARYEQSDNSTYLSVRVVQDHDRLCALLPDGILLLMQGDNGKIRRLRLPRLPAHYHYTRVILFRDRVYAAWEDIRFFRVGAAGLTTLPLADTY
jgi:hypothetical protein